jgi:uncharacterized protein YbbC (DUF1343 family)
MKRLRFKSIHADEITRRNGETEKPELSVIHCSRQDIGLQNSISQNRFFRFFSVSPCLRVSIGFLVVLYASSCFANVLPGIDVLSLRNYDVLQGKRVGLITNHTGRSFAGASTIDLFHRAPGVRLTALFSPEHGIRGESDDKVASGTDVQTGLPIHSLYGATCRPTVEMLKDVDILVFDIQDIGTRFYTYIGTLSLAMRAAKEAGIPFVVLDRPNPIGGVLVQGAIPKSPLATLSKSGVTAQGNGCGGITSIHPIPTRHGMTIGELAQLFNAEFGIGCDLKVIPMLGWQRSMLFDQTGVNWINPSPNMKSLSAAILYPGPGILETTNLSVGRGTGRPFEMYGAPWVNAENVLKNLRVRTIPGVAFAVVEFVPTAAGHPYRGKACYGVRVVITDREQFDPILAGLHLVQAFYQTHPRQFKRYGGFATEAGDREAWDLLTKMGMPPEFVAGRWTEGLEQFRKLREKHLLY